MLSFGSGSGILNVGLKKKRKWHIQTFKEWENSVLVCAKNNPRVLIIICYYKSLDSVRIHYDLKYLFEILCWT